MNIKSNNFTKYIISKNHPGYLYYREILNSRFNKKILETIINPKSKSMLNYNNKFPKIYDNKKKLKNGTKIYFNKNDKNNHYNPFWANKLLNNNDYKAQAKGSSYRFLQSKNTKKSESNLKYITREKENHNNNFVKQNQNLIYNNNSNSKNMFYNNFISKKNDNKIYNENKLVENSNKANNNNLIKKDNNIINNDKLENGIKDNINNFEVKKVQNKREKEEVIDNGNEDNNEENNEDDEKFDEEQEKLFYKNQKNFFKARKDIIEEPEYLEEDNENN